MKWHDLRPTIERKGLAPLYLVVGEEDYLRDEAVATIRSAAVGPADADAFNMDAFYGEECAAEDILGCVREVPVFAERRLVIVKSAEKLPAREGEALVSYLRNPVSTSTLVFSTAKLDGRLKFAQALKEAAQTVECPPLPAGQTPGWIRAMAGRIGVTLEEDAVQALAEMAGHSLYFLKQELDKLAAAVPPGRSARAEDVEALRGVEPGASVFDLSDAVASGDQARALRIVARNLDAGEAPLRIFGSLVWQYRRLWKAQALLDQGRPEGEIGRVLGVPPFRAREWVTQARRFSPEQLRAAFRLFLETDDALKGGSAVAPALRLEWLVLRLCAQAAPRRPRVDETSGAPRGGTSGPAPRKTKPIPTIRTVRPGTRRSS